MLASRTVSQVLGFLLFSVLATTASAQDRPPYGTAVNAATAKKIAAAVLAECQKNNWRVAVAVVDNHGFLIHFDRIDDTQTASSQIAVDKAKASAMYRRPTRAFAEAIAKGGPAIMTLPGVVASPGGLPIMVKGRVIGGGGLAEVVEDLMAPLARAVPVQDRCWAWLRASGDSARTASSINDNRNG